MEAAMKHGFALVCLGYLLASVPASAVILDTLAIGRSYSNGGGGFAQRPAPDNLGLAVGTSFDEFGNFTGETRSSFQFFLRDIPNFATINSASLILPGFTNINARIVLTNYADNGLFEPIDVNLTFESLVLAAGTGEQSFDITAAFRSFYQVGTDWLGYSASMQPLGQCFVPAPRGCSSFLGWSREIGPNWPALTPRLVVDYTPLAPPPPPPLPGIPEPQSWAMFIAGFALIGLRRRRGAMRAAV
jgi:hypothetical protein